MFTNEEIKLLKRTVDGALTALLLQDSSVRAEQSNLLADLTFLMEKLTKLEKGER